MILDEIKKANLQALKEKNHNARAVYSVVITKAMLETVKKREKGEELQDNDMIHILQKTLKELSDEAESYRKASNLESEKLILEQKNIIQKYLPLMLSDEQIRDIISQQEDKSVPSIMKFFKANYAGKVDMGKVNKILREFNN